MLKVLLAVKLNLAIFSVSIPSIDISKVYSPSEIFSRMYVPSSLETVPFGFVVLSALYSTILAKGKVSFCLSIILLDILCCAKTEKIPKKKKSCGK